MKVNYSVSDVLKIYDDKDSPNVSWKGAVLRAFCAGFVVSVDDGMEWVVSKSDNFEEIRDAVESVDDCVLQFWATNPVYTDDGKEERHKVTVDGKDYWDIGWMQIILSNEPYEHISDYNVNHFMEWLATNPHYVNPYKNIKEKNE